MVEGFIIVRTTLDFFFFLKLKMSTEKEKKYFYAKVPKLKKTTCRVPISRDTARTHFVC